MKSGGTISQSQEVRWLFVDLNSYFASVEQQMRPELRGKPVGVLPVMTDRTCCIAASYEAKAFGIKTGTSVSEAKKLCPEIQFVEARHKIYVDYHHKIIQAVEACHPVTAVLSIDEMACRLGGRDQKVENAIKLAQEIKKNILRVGSELGCSVGLAPNRFLAKVASDMQKPDGLTIITLEDLPHKLYSLKLNDFPGIGRQMDKRLQARGIQTVSQLMSLPMHSLREIWGGVLGERFYQWLRGIDLELSTDSNKSLGHSHVLPPQLRNIRGAHVVGQKLLQKAAMRLRKIDAWASKMSLYIHYVDGTSWDEQAKILECQDTFTLLEAFNHLWAKQPKRNPIKVSVNLTDLILSQDRNFSFFDNNKRAILSRSMDKLIAQYGTSSIYFGSLHDITMATPTRIAFTSIPDFSLD
ncbi:MAG: DNA polymerase [Oligoflexia bacterium]|nr:DNA polymerase [Oligoflexia bacterium]